MRPCSLTCCALREENVSNWESSPGAGRNYQRIVRCLGDFLQLLVVSEVVMS